MVITQVYLKTMVSFSFFSSCCLILKAINYIKHRPHIMALILIFTLNPHPGFSFLFYATYHTENTCLRLSNSNFSSLINLFLTRRCSRLKSFMKSFKFNPIYWCMHFSRTDLETFRNITKYDLVWRLFYCYIIVTHKYQLLTLQKEKFTENNLFGSSHN